MSKVNVHVLEPINADVTFITETLLTGEVVYTVAYRCVCGKQHRRVSRFAKLCRAFVKSLEDSERRSIEQHLRGERSNGTQV